MMIMRNIKELEYFIQEKNLTPQSCGLTDRRACLEDLHDPYSVATTLALINGANGVQTL